MITQNKMSYWNKIDFCNRWARERSLYSSFLLFLFSYNKKKVAIVKFCAIFLQLYLVRHIRMIPASHSLTNGTLHYQNDIRIINLDTVAITSRIKLSRAIDLPSSTWTRTEAHLLVDISVN